MHSCVIMHTNQEGKAQAEEKTSCLFSAEMDELIRVMQLVRFVRENVMISRVLKSKKNRKRLIYGILFLKQDRVL